MSPEFRQECANFLKRRGYESYMGVLPTLSVKTIDRWFGPKHASWKCVWRSALLSSCALGCTFVVTLIFNPKDTFNFFNWLLALGPKGLGVVVGAWIMACLVPDYLMLGKTRFVIWVLQRADLSLGTMLLIGVIDFFAANWMFLSAFVSVQVIGIEGYMWVAGKIPKGSNLLTMSVGGAVVFLILLLVEAAVLGAQGQLYLTIPLANFFWASMVPSGWLWLFVGSSIATRFLVSLQPGFGFLVYALDVEAHPVRSIGIIASTVVAAVTLFMVGMVSLIGL